MTTVDRVRRASGFTTGPGTTTDDVRIRDIAQALTRPGRAPVHRRGHGATGPQLPRIAAEGPAEARIRAGIARAHGVGVEYTDAERIDIEL
ncbi:hypothetical protein AB0L59_26075 [Streptomyces sp. NPDC052109]|uniref:hypothetical protein n=1 Tax=Streptomyces sp. NPDC052109 TaxID=3155527 RepID=UPI0034439CFE